MIIAVLVVASVVSTLVVLLRCYSRAVVLRSFGLDDAIIVPAQVPDVQAVDISKGTAIADTTQQILTIASAVAIGLGTKVLVDLLLPSAIADARAETRWGLGRHAWMMPEEDKIIYMKASRRSNWVSTKKGSSKG
jgi:hypothetical protein